MPQARKVKGLLLPCNLRRPLEPIEDSSFIAEQTFQPSTKGLEYYLQDYADHVPQPGVVIAKIYPDEDLVLIFDTDYLNMMRRRALVGRNIDVLTPGAEEGLWYDSINWVALTLLLSTSGLDLDTCARDVPLHGPVLVFGREQTGIRMLPEGEFQSWALVSLTPFQLTYLKRVRERLLREGAVTLN